MKLSRRQLFPLLAGPALGATLPDWPQWRGPQRNGLSKETGLLKAWPAGGPPKLWSVDTLGEGYGTVAIAGDRMYVQGVQSKESVVFALNRANGAKVWASSLGSRLDQDRGPGPRGTPTADGTRLYVLTEGGELACLNAKDGASIWRRNLLQEFKGRNPHWLISESPLVDGDRLIVTPGGDGATIVTLNKLTGETIWESKDLNDGAGYSSCVVEDIQGIRTIMTITAKAGVGVRASDGKLMWRYEQVSNRTANVATPVYSDNHVFYSTAYGTGCALLSLKKEGSTLKAGEVYFSKEMMNHHGGVVLVKDHLYGFSNAILTAMEFKTGKVAWRDRSVGKGSLTYADGMLYLLGEKNICGLAVAKPEAYQEKGRFDTEDSGWPNWAHPVVCDGKLYLRNQAKLTCYNVKA